MNEDSCVDTESEENHIIKQLRSPGGGHPPLRSQAEAKLPDGSDARGQSSGRRTSIAHDGEMPTVQCRACAGSGVILGVEGNPVMECPMCNGQGSFACADLMPSSSDESNLVPTSDTSNDMVQEDAGPIHVHRDSGQPGMGRQVIWSEDANAETLIDELLNELDPSPTSPDAENRPVPSTPELWAGQIAEWAEGAEAQPERVEGGSPIFDRLVDAIAQRRRAEVAEYDFVNAVDGASGAATSPGIETSAGRGFKWEMVKIFLDSGSTVNIMPRRVLRGVDEVPCTGKRAGRKMFAANGTPIEAHGEKKFREVASNGFELDCEYISADVKKILQSVAEACDDGDRGRWVIHIQSGGWIVDLATRQKLPFEREGNNYSYKVWVRVPDGDDDGVSQVFSLPGKR